MFNVCLNCGTYSDKKEIVTENKISYAICPNCKFKYEFLKLPLFVVTGASCTGKSTLCNILAKSVTNFVCFSADVLLNTVFKDDWHKFRNLCLRIAKNINQAGKPTIIFGSTIPSQYEECAERRYFGNSYYLALVCNDNELKKRLKNRPSWRNSSSPVTIKKMLEFNQWFKDNNNNTIPKMSILDNSTLALVESSEKIKVWLNKVNN
jgi:adenylate kinase family enzyme